MVLELVAIIAAVIVSFMVSGLISAKFGINGFPQLGIEMLLLSVTAFILAELSLLPIGAGALAVGVSAVIGGIGILNKKRQSKKARAGGYGDEVKWATELVDDGDQMFIIALNGVSQTEMKEIGIIAESKEQLRELTIERFEEQSDEQVPEEFMQ